MAYLGSINIGDAHPMRPQGDIAGDACGDEQEIETKTGQQDRRSGRFLARLCGGASKGHVTKGESGPAWCFTKTVGTREMLAASIFCT